MKALAGVVLVAVAVLAVGATAASAETPEFGECVAVPKGTGEYIGKLCITKSASNKGNYDWKAGPPAKAKFEGIGEEIHLETVTKRSVSCGESLVSGEITGAKTISAKLRLVGCDDTLSKDACNTVPVAQEGEIESAPLTGELGYIKGGEFPVVGLDLKATAPGKALFAFECAKFPELAPPEIAAEETVEGSVIGPIKPVTKLADEFSVLYRALNGKQKVKAFEGGEEDVLSTTFVEGLTSHTETTALVGGLPFTVEEALRIKPKTKMGA